MTAVPAVSPGPTTDLHRAMLRSAATPVRDWAPNRFDGFDFTLADGRMLRVTHEDPESSRVGVFVFNGSVSLTLLAEADLRGIDDANTLAAVLLAFARATA